MSTIELTLFGQPRLRQANQLLDLKVQKGWAILAYLAAAGRRQNREILATLLWPENDQDSARANLRRTFYRLNQALAEPWLYGDREYIELRLPPAAEVDVISFAEHYRARRLEAAAALYQGDFLTGFYLEDSEEFEAWATMQRESFRRQALTALESLAAAALADGEAAAAADFARRLLVIDNLHEAGARQLMHALTLNGERAAALAEYERLAALLDAELGVAPDAATRQLHEQIVGGTLTAPAPVVTIIRPPAPAGRRHNLPAATTPFIGREMELAQLMAQLGAGAQRLVTIVGPGGMGKTRLALAAAERLRDAAPAGGAHFADGIFFVDLAPVTDAVGILDTIAAALAYRFKTEEQGKEAEILDFLRSRSMLLILNNFEQLLVEHAAGTRLVQAILAAAPQVKLLVTSRQRLNLASESLLLLSGLDRPEPATAAARGFDAVQLFLQSARRVRPDFDLTDANQAAVGRICRLVEGLPLGIILAAAWLEMLTPAEIAAEIEQNVDFLAAEMADLPERQRSIQAVFNYSWQLLTPAEQQAFARLSVFRGGFTRAAAQTVAGADLRLLLGLTNKSLLGRDDETGRYSLHELLRQYAETRLGADAVPLRAAHGEYYARFVADRWAFHYFNSPGALAELVADHENVRRAWTYAWRAPRPDLLAQMALGLADYFGAHGQVQIGRDLFAPALAAVAAGSWHHAVIQTGCAWLWFHTHFSRAQELTLAVLPQLEAAPDHVLVFAYLIVGFAVKVSGDFPAAYKWFDKAVAAARPLTDPLPLAEAELRWVEAENEAIWTDLMSRGLGRAFAQMPQLVDQAHVHRLIDRLAQCLDQFQAAAPQHLSLFSVFSIGKDLLLLQNDLPGAYAMMEKGLAVAEPWRNVYYMSLGLMDMVRFHAHWRQLAEARLRLRQALEWHVSLAQDWQTLGVIASIAGEFPDLVGGPAAALSYLAMVDGHPDKIGSYQWELIDPGAAQLRDRLTPAEFEAAWATGQGLTLAGAVTTIFAALDEGSEP